MSSDALAAQVDRIVAEVLEIEVTAAESAHRAALGQWDSLNHLRILVAIEEAFSVQLDTEQSVGIGSCADIKQILRLLRASS